MPATRNAIEVKARIAGTDTFCTVQRRSFGSAKNLQRQCATGELEYDPAQKCFRTVPADKRKKFDPATVTTNQRFSLKDQHPVSAA